MAYIYLIEFPKHPNLVYIGKSRRPGIVRINEHFHSNNTKTRTDKLCRWYKKNNIPTINTVLAECGEDEMDSLEVFYIRYMKFLGLKLTNHTDKETKSVDWTDERKQQQRNRRLNTTFGIEVRNKMSESKKGRIVTWGEKISKTKKGKPNPFSESHLENIRKARKISHSKAVTQMDLEGNIIQSFESMLDAAKYLLSTTHCHLTLNGLKNGIKDCCVGRQQKCAGYKWVYKK